MKVTAILKRSGKWWAISVPEVPGVFSQVKRLDQAVNMTKEAVALMLNIEPRDIDVDVEIALSKSLMKQAKEVRELSKNALEAQSRAMERKKAVALQLHSNEGLSVRDVAEILDMSPQRVSQLCRNS